MSMPGGFKQPSPVTNDEMEILHPLKSSVEEKIGKVFHHFEGISYTTQVVAGINYLFKVKVDNDEYIHVKVHKPLPHKQEAPFVLEATTGHSLDSPLP